MYLKQNLEIAFMEASYFLLSDGEIIITDPWDIEY